MRPETSATNVDDARLLTQLRAGDDAAYELLVRTYGARMLAAARRICGNDEEAQDALQDAFLSAFRALPEFQGQSALGTWLHRIAINAALMRLRSSRRREDRDAIDVDELLPRFTAGGHHEQAPRTWSESADIGAQRSETRALVR